MDSLKGTAPSAIWMPTLGGVLRWIGLVVDAAAVCVLLGYFLPLTFGIPFWQWVTDRSSVDASLWDSNFVSDLLFDNAIYRSLLSAILGIHLLVCGLFAVRLNGSLLVSVDAVCVLLVFELVFLMCSWLGWNVLTVSYENSEGDLTVGHYAGTGVFVSGNVGYFVLMLFNVINYSGRPRWTQLQRFVLGLAVTLFVVSCSCGSYFVWGVLSDQHDFGWIFEHCAFIFFFGANFLVFVLCELWCRDGASVHADGPLARLRYAFPSSMSCFMCEAAYICFSALASDAACEPRRD